jgi:hypothetical protein
LNITFWLCVCFLGGPKLRKWYGAPDLLEKDGTSTSNDAADDYPGRL